MYKDKVEEHQGKKGFMELDDVYEGEVSRKEGNKMLKENQ